MTIYLGAGSPRTLIATRRNRRTNEFIPVGVASDRVYMAAYSRIRR